MGANTGAAAEHERRKFKLRLFVFFQKAKGGFFIFMMFF